MGIFFAILALGVFWIVFCCFAFYKSMGLSLDYWTDKQYKLWKIISASIGICFLLAVMFLCIFSKDRFSFEMNRIAFVLILMEFLAMGIFSQVIHFIAWKKKLYILECNIREMLKDNESITDKQQLLEICFNENSSNFTKKQIERKLNKIMGMHETG